MNVIFGAGKFSNVHLKVEKEKNIYTCKSTCN